MVRPTGALAGVGLKAMTALLIEPMTTPDQTNPGPAAEKRRAARTRCLRAARCVFNRGYSDLTVLVRNISATGAKLTGDELFCLPDEFELQMASPSGAVMARWVRRVWSRPDSIGVEFLEPERKLPPNAIDPSVALRR